MALSVKCIASKYEDLDLIFQNPSKKLSMVMYTEAIALGMWEQENPWGSYHVDSSED